MEWAFARPLTRQWRRRLLGSSLSVVVNIAVFAALLWPHANPPPPAESAALLLSPVQTPRPPAPPSLTEDEAAAPSLAVQPTPPRVLLPQVRISETPVPDTSDLLSESQLAGAATAGAGTGGSCDIAQLLQQTLRRDPLVRAAVEDAHRLGRAVMLWDGDWVRTGGQDGKGLSAVREAIMWAVAFTPEVCRNQHEHGLVLLSLADNTTRFAIGSSDWRWSDLLYARGTGSVR